LLVSAKPIIKILF